ncbi:hypothetical protein [Thalassospira profundimaris]|uniref:Uncharacterized protein n=1 Tax=Thalassospira profundimaris TaxID=502049 RepID=A0A367WP35_9PROT|nr:hypothetical protein [Thalassospira profundimaris]RCK43235.1 hypothetical protein TH30_19660 [Thalassospira profundimaris]
MARPVGKRYDHPSGADHPPVTPSRIRRLGREAQVQPIKLKSAGIPAAQPKKLKAILECLDYLLDQRGAPVNVTQKVGAVIVKYKEMQPIEAGY